MSGLKNLQGSFPNCCHQWQSQNLSSWGAKLKDSIKNAINLKILISINNKIKQFYLVRRV